MRGRVIGIAVVVLAIAAAGSVAAQPDARPAAKPSDSKRSEGPITLTGCVEPGAGPNDYVIDDVSVGKYKVSGNRINRFVGQRVEVVGSLDSGRLRFRGGLYPSPNVAGQAGAMDPVKAAIAAQPGGPSAGTGGVQLPELKVKSVKTLSDACR